MSFPGGSVGKESTCDVGDLSSIPGLGRSPGGGLGNPLQYSFLENPHGQRSLAGYSPWDHIELDMTDQLSTAQHISGSSAGKESACSIGDTGSILGSGRSPGEVIGFPTPVFLPGEYPWTEEPDGLQSMGSQRVGMTE